MLYMNKSDVPSSSPADSTGTHSLYTTYQGYEVMFHVSTMLPYMPNNPQQVSAGDRQDWGTRPFKIPLSLSQTVWRSQVSVALLSLLSPSCFMAFVLCVQAFLSSLISFFFCPPILWLDQSWVWLSRAQFLCLKNLIKSRKFLCLAPWGIVFVFLFLFNHKVWMSEHVCTCAPTGHVGAQRLWKHRVVSTQGCKTAQDTNDSFSLPDVGIIFLFERL